MAPSLVRDVHLGITLAFLFGIVLHTVLAFWTAARARKHDAQIFATANGLLAVSLLVQLVEFGVAVGRIQLAPDTARGLLGSQLAANLLVLAIFFQVLASFPGRPDRPRTGMRTRLVGMLHRHAGLLVPVAYGVVALGGLFYLSDAGGVASLFASLRSQIGPTSAYVFGASLWALCFVMFPARAGQEHLAVPVAGRALLLTSLGLVIGLVALWHGSRPRITSELLLPILHLHSVPVVVFLALVRYEFAFMDRFVLGTVRAAGWTVVVLGSYWIWHRVPVVLGGQDPLVFSVARIAVLLGAMVLAPRFGGVLARWSERVFFARRTSLETMQRRFAGRLAEGRGLGALIEATCGDIADALRARGVRVVVGDSASPGREPVRLERSLRVDDREVGRLLLGDRRDLLPYFDGERKLIDGLAPLLAGAIAAFRQQRPQAVEERGPEHAHATETPPHPPAARRGDERAVPRRTWPEPTITLSSRWQSDVLSAAARVGERDVDAGARILGLLDRAAAHLKTGGERQVALETEFEFARDLFALENLRRNNQLHAAVHFPTALADQAVPRGVALRLMAKLIATERPEGGWQEAKAELRAVESEGRVELSLDAPDRGTLRAHFPRRETKSDATP